MNNTSCILTVIKNEQDYLDEWIKYHIDLGINHIFIFEDIDSDSHKEITDKYEDKVTLDSILTVLNEDEKEIAFNLKRTKQWNAQHLYFKNALNFLLTTYPNIYDWCFIIDIDEFITLEKENTKLIDILSLYENYDAFIMHWKCYGANGFVKKPDYSEKGVIETYVNEAEGIVNDNPQSFMKTCHNLNTYKKEFFYNQHHPTNKSNWIKTDFTKNPRTTIYNNIYIRHYMTKSWEEYAWKQLKRGFMWGGKRNFDFFFTLNPDMNDKKEELILKLYSNSENKVLVVLPYSPKEAQGKELQLALKGWRKFCTFDYHFVVVGEFDTELVEEFPWVEFIECKQIEKIKCQYTPHLDVQRKMECVMEKYGNDYPGFIRTMDDIYAIKPFTLNDIITIHYNKDIIEGSERAPESYWLHDKWKTKQLLDREKLPRINYATHFPCYFEFDRLKEMWDKYNMREESYAYEDIYFNSFPHSRPVLDSEIRYIIYNISTSLNELPTMVEKPNIKFINNTISGWSRKLEEYLNNIINNT